MESLGIKVAVRYGVQLKLLQSTMDGVEDLTYLLKYCKFFLQGQQRTTDVTLRILVKEAQDLIRSTMLIKGRTLLCLTTYCPNVKLKV